MATTACSVENRPKRQYAGQLTSSSPSCPATRGTLVMQRDAVVFAPEEGTWVLDGKVVGTAIVAARSRPGFDHKTYATEFRGTLTDTNITGSYVTPTCTYTVDLIRFNA